MWEFPGASLRCLRNVGVVLDRDVFVQLTAKVTFVVSPTKADKRAMACSLAAIRFVGR